MLYAHAYEPLVPVHQFHEAVPADLQRVILRCLEKDPDRRYQDAASLDKALAACACAGQWTPERAEDWWRQHTESTMPASSLEALERDSRALAATWLHATREGDRRAASSAERSG
jgi:serine/threonine-protein kinase